MLDEVFYFVRKVERESGSFRGSIAFLHRAIPEADRINRLEGESL